ncbi:MAG TPA: hypothetical protein VGM88_34985 [Kofleriaceae bacterium]|jgi:hypothetical protein
MLRPLLFAATAALFVVPYAFADGDHHGPHGPPPQAAIDACSSAKAGDACTFSMHDHSISGTCFAPPDGAALACRPDHPPGPPPEAIAACNGATEGASCTVTFDNHSLTGTCEKGPDGAGALACHPPHGPHGH